MSTVPAGVSMSPVRVAARARVALQPLGLDAVRITGGFWLDRQRTNGSISIPDGFRRLEEAGNIDNFRITAGIEPGRVRGPVFSDSDVYKWLEAAAWEYGRAPDQQLLQDQLDVTSLIDAAREDDGYVNSMVQARGDRYRDLARDHELYCAGHLFQAAVAQSRCTGSDRLLKVARAFADHLTRTFGPGKREDVDGHPVVEMGLVELYRQTGCRRYLDMARYFVDARGHGLTSRSGGDPVYLSDRVPVREAVSVEGHAVRALYLAAGATDVAIESGDGQLLAALGKQYAHMLQTKQYLTGGLGSRWDREAFGDPYELPADRAYAETCAGIGAVQWAWRMLLATADAGYADQIERLLYNAILPGVSLSGDKYFYVNTLHLRQDACADHQRSPAGGRQHWFDCACCPPNLMRTFAQLAGYLATVTEDGVQIHQYAPAAITAQTKAGPLAVRVETRYPWDGSARVVVEEAPGGEVALALRIPAWADGATVDGRPVPAAGYATMRRTFTAGDEVRVELPLRVRATRAGERVDAVRGCTALERGPLVYALEEPDQQRGVVVDDLRVDGRAGFRAEHRPDLLGGVTVIRFPARQAGSSVPVTATAIPYYAWANRGAPPMRVWLPLA